MAKKNENNGRQHKASFSKDSRNPGKYNVLVEGPNAQKFATKRVPVGMRNGTEKEVQLLDCFWFGPDEGRSDENGNMVEAPKPGHFKALYHFKPEEREPEPEPEF